VDLRFVTKVTDPEYIPYALAGTPSLDLRFASTKSLVDKVSGKNLITFTRASGGTYVGSDGLIKTASTNEPRFDHNPLTGESLGLLVEEQRINRLLHNRDLTQAAWVATNITPAKDQIGADGVSNSASSITSTAGNGTILQTITSASAARATSAYVKRITGSGAVEMTQNGGTTWTAVTVTGDWTRIQIPSATVTNPVVGFRIVASGDAIAVDYVQCEDGTFITSPIATGAATATRSADVASITGTNFSSWYRQDEGTVLTECAVAQPNSGGNQFVFRASDNSFNNSVAWNIQASGFSSIATSAAGVFDGVATNSIALSANVIARFAGSYKANDLALSLSGGALVTDATVTIPTALTRADIGSDHIGSNRIRSGTIRRLTYWPRRLPNTTLQAITSTTLPTVFGNIKLDNGNSPAAIAGVAPTLDFRPARDRREIEAVSLTDKLTFTGGNQGTFVGSDGYIQRAQTNVPRFTHDPVTRRSLGMLLEVSGENLLLRSEQFDIAGVWGVLNTTVTANTQLAPSGTTSAETLTDVNGITSANFGCFQAITLADNTTYAMSCYVKAGTKNTCRVGIRAKNGVNIFANFNLATVSTTVGNALSSSIEDAGNGWYRCIAICASASGATSQRGLVFMDTVSYLANGNGTIHVYGADLQAGASPTSYIPTTTSTVARTADSAVLDGTGVITGAYTMVEKPEGCAVISGTNINLQNGFTVERVVVFPAALSPEQITAIRNVM
jgi:hypothetical protein